MDSVPLTTTTTAATLAEWIAGLEPEAIPELTREQAKSCFIDSVACSIGSLALEPMKVLLDVLSSISPGPVLVPGTQHRLSAVAAAHFGSQAANALDFDDSFRAGAPSHPGATVVPPALAVGADRGSSGAELLAAVVAGFEVSLRIGRAVQPSPARKGEVMGFAAWQSFGAMTAAAKLMKLEPARILSAFGLTGAQAPVPAGRKFLHGQRPYSWIKNAYGISSEVGVLSALLAERGFHGDHEIFDGRYGFWIMCGSDRYRRDLATEALGDEWLVHEVGFKPYACCRWTHTMIDAIRSMKTSLAGEEVKHVRVRGFRELYDLGGVLPASIVDAQFNAPYVAALELAGHSPQFGLKEEQLSDPEVLRLASIVELVHEPAFDPLFHEKGELPVLLEVTTAEGKSFSASVRHPSGSPAAGGFSYADMDSKFLQLVSPVLGDEKTRNALDLLRNMERHSAHEIASALAISV